MFDLDLGVNTSYKIVTQSCSNHDSQHRKGFSLIFALAVALDLADENKFNAR